MKKILIYIFFIIFIYPVFSKDIMITGYPLEYYNGYTVDLNLDKKDDIILYFNMEKKYILLALLSEGNNYKSYILHKSKELNNIYIYELYSINEGIKGKRERTIKCKDELFKIPGPFIQLVNHKSKFKMIIYWDKGKFNEIWTSD